LRDGGGREGGPRDMTNTTNHRQRDPRRNNMKDLRGGVKVISREKSQRKKGGGRSPNRPETQAQGGVAGGLDSEGRESEDKSSREYARRGKFSKLLSYPSNNPHGGSLRGE